MPNLEDCALLDISYKYLHEEITGENDSERLYDIPELDGLSDEDKEEFLIQIFDYFRHRRCMYDNNRTENAVIDLEKSVRNTLLTPWSLEDNDRILPSQFIYISRDMVTRCNKHCVESGGPRSKLAQFVKDYLRNHRGPEITTDEDYVQYIQSLFSKLDNYIICYNGLYQLHYDMLVWN